jgi:formate-dependent phosphoribosylglycinamide formyltransferase (GAR transformylase)
MITRSRDNGSSICENGNTMNKTIRDLASRIRFKTANYRYATCRGIAKKVRSRRNALRVKPLMSSSEKDNPP